jgi:hypothetical protein
MVFHGRGWLVFHINPLYRFCLANVTEMLAPSRNIGLHVTAAESFCNQPFNMIPEVFKTNKSAQFTDLDLGYLDILRHNLKMSIRMVLVHIEIQHKALGLGLASHHGSHRIRPGWIRPGTRW